MISLVRRSSSSAGIAELSAASACGGCSGTGGGSALVALGLDSILAIEIQSRIETGIGVKLSVLDLLRGVSSYAYELFNKVADLDTVYVPIGQGSGICSTIMIRDLMGLKTKIVGVVAENAPSYALSFEAGKPVSTNDANTIADGVACRVPDAVAVEIINRGADRIVRVTEDEIRQAMHHYFTDTHNLAEGAGAVPLAALMQERDQMAGRKVGVILSGGNVDAALFRSVMAA